MITQFKDGLIHVTCNACAETTSQAADPAINPNPFAGLCGCAHCGAMLEPNWNLVKVIQARYQGHQDTLKPAPAPATKFFKNKVVPSPNKLATKR